MKTIHARRETPEHILTLDSLDDGRILIIGYTSEEIPEVQETLLTTKDVVWLYHQLHDILEKENNYSFELEHLRLLATKALDETKLNERERTVLEHRFGIGACESKDMLSLDELAKKLVVTRERVRQIEARALQKIRQNASELDWYPYKRLLWYRGYLSFAQAIVNFM